MDTLLRPAITQSCVLSLGASALCSMLCSPLFASNSRLGPSQDGGGKFELGKSGLCALTASWQAAGASGLMPGYWGSSDNSEDGDNSMAS